MDITNTQPAELPIHPYTRLRALGLLPSGRIVWPVLGGAEDDAGGADGDDDQDDDVGADDDSGDGDDDQDNDGDGKPKDKGATDGDKTVSRAELAKVITARDKAKADLRAKNRELEELRRTSETADETARREAAESAQKAADAKYKPISARAALLEAGVKPARVKGALKLLDLDEIEIDEDGEVIGLDAQVATLKDEWPELFAEPDGDQAKKPGARPGRGADGADRKPAPKKELTATERQAAMLLGKL
jgi:hypothetical protein